MLMQIFEQLLSMALTALPVMAVVLAARWLLRGAPKKYTFLLWAVVAFRLVCPVSIRSAFSLFSLLDTPKPVEVAPVTGTDFSAVQPFTPTLTPTPAPPVTPTPNTVTVQVGPSSELVFLEAASLVWAAGVMALLCWLIFSTLRLKRQVATAVRREDNVWECDSISTPFVLGLFRPRIYIPFRMTEGERSYILAHERYHIRCGDHWVKLLALLLLAVYWWNPAAWLCWVLFVRDMEMRCDEAVLSRLGDAVKQEYSLSLVSFALDRRAPMALAFGEHDAAKRVKNVLKWKQAKPAVIFLAIAAVILVALVCGTNAAQKNRLTLKQESHGTEFSWELDETFQSWALYQDIYEDGRLVTSEPRVMDTFREVGGTSSRSATFVLRVQPVYDEDGGFVGELECILLHGNGRIRWTPKLPKDHYTGMGGGLAGAVDEDMLKFDLQPDGDVLLYSVLLSTDELGWITFQDRDKGIIGANDTVVQFRLVTSSQADFPFADEDFRHQNLFNEILTMDTHQLTEYLLDAELWDDAIRQPYLAAWTGNLGPSIGFSEPPEDADALNVAMARRAALLMKLRPFEVRSVTWNYPTDDGSLSLHDLHSTDLDFITGFSSDLRVYGNIESSTDLARFIDFLNLDPKLFIRLGEAGNSTEAEPPVEEEPVEEIPTGEEPPVEETPAPEEDRPAPPVGTPLTVLSRSSSLYDAQTAMDAEMEQQGFGHAGSGGSVGGISIRTYEKDNEFFARLITLDGTVYALPLPVVDADGNFAEAKYTHLNMNTMSFSYQAEVADTVYDDAGMPLHFPGMHYYTVYLENLTYTESFEPKEYAPELFTGLMGYDGYAVTLKGKGDIFTRSYYTIHNGETVAIAQSFGFGAPQDYIVDIDGDGVTELVANVTYTGDGARRVWVYQAQNGHVRKGELTPEGLTDFNDWGINAYWVEYDPVQKVFRLHYDRVGQTDPMDTGLLEVRDLSRFVFDTFTPF